MQSLEDNKTIALNAKDIEQDTLAIDENGKNDSKGIMYTDFRNKDSRCKKYLELILSRIKCIEHFFQLR